MRRLVVPEASLAEGALALPKELAHYVRDVLRLGEGAGLLLLDGAGGEAEAELRAVDKKQVTLQVGPVRRTPAPSPALVLLQAVGKGDKMDQVVRQATELGVAEVVPVLTARAVARQEGRVERWRTICEDAVRVAGHRHRPRIAEVTPLTEALAGAPEGLRLALALDAAAPLAQRLAEAEPGVPITVLVGPEGGLTPDEVAEARAAGFLAAHLGDRTLRTETAGPAVLAIVAFWAGRLGGHLGA
ncbi:MAG: 16S rRNA (uracil(1498)-N(3))-methyltransferase [Deltaproteobacteria bacterium]|nr:16S rRNA (uracil(1498)-N(3))-methyltransferase [Deltaproteobacteria bacterium]